jgi:hypothetical protein
MAFLLGPLPPAVERKARDWFARLDEREWTPVNWHKLSDAEQRALDRLCLCGAAQQRMRETLSVDGVEHVIRVVLSGDCSEQLEAEYGAQLLVHFGRGRQVTTVKELELEAIRLTARGQAIREGADPRHELVMAVSGTFFPAPGSVEWLGWDVLTAAVDADRQPPSASTEAPDSPAQTGEELPEETGNDSSAVQQLLRVFTNGVVDDRIAKAAAVLNTPRLTVHEKLMQIDAVLPFPATASAEQLGVLLGVSKQAVLKSKWWSENRKGEKASEVGRRRDVHRERAKEYERDRFDDSVT